MGLHSLLLCRDPETLRTLRRALDEVGVGVELSNATDSALARLERSKFDAVIIDCDDVAKSAEMLEALQQSPSNKRAIVMALINGKTSMRAAFEKGAHFALDKPISLERALRALRAAQGFMVAEQRRYFRQSVDGTASLSSSTAQQLACRVTNISDGGMAVKLGRQLNPAPSGIVEVRFELPGVAETLEAKGEFAWADTKGNVGIRFTQVPPECKKQLSKWLAERPAGGTHGGLAGALPTPQRPVSV